MNKAILALTLISAAAALLAAIFWFLSAWGDLPPIVAYWDKAPTTDPLYRALQSGVRMNRMAALLSGCSALAYCGATVLPMIAGSR